MMTKYLNATGRPILFSCSWPDYERAKGIPVSLYSLSDLCVFVFFAEQSDEH